MKLFENIVWPPPGRYVVAVSGGVDSIALLDLLATSAREADWRLEVAHFNHGWSGEAGRYEALVEEAAQRYGLLFHRADAKVKMTEAAGRQARYSWLREVMAATGAEAVMTAHHHDDLIETVALNLTRGSGRRGLTPFSSTKDVLRPLAAVPKAELVEYATGRQLDWIEDLTNTDTRFRRNAVRHELLPQLRRDNAAFDRELEAVVGEAAALNARIDRTLAALITRGEGTVSAPTAVLRRLPLATLTEVIVMMVQAARPGTELSRRSVEALAVDVKTGRARGVRRLTNSLFATGARDTVTIAFTP